MMKCKIEVTPFSWNDNFGLDELLQSGEEIEIEIKVGEIDE